MVKVTLFGKDCKSNRKTLRDNVDLFSENIVCVGVQSFKDILNSGEGLVKYFPRQKNDVQYICKRLADMLDGVETVYMLPIRGNMTTIEELMAKEIGCKIIDLH